MENNNLSIDAKQLAECVRTQGYFRQDNYIWFGFYPQTIAPEGVSFTALDNNTLQGDDGFLYVMHKSYPYKSSYQKPEPLFFTNGKKIKDFEKNYFRIEPLCWRVMREEADGSLFVVSNRIIDAAKFNETSFATKINGHQENVYNNYAQSDIRKWLNGAFIAAAFDSRQQAMLPLSNVCNACLNKYDGTPNKHACKDTQDKVFLLSYEEVQSRELGFSADLKTETRSLVTTDYARSKSAFVEWNSSKMELGYWWLRTPCCVHNYAAQIVYSSGWLATANCDSYENGVVPAMRIQVK